MLAQPREIPDADLTDDLVKARTHSSCQGGLTDDLFRRDVSAMVAEAHALRAD